MPVFEVSLMQSPSEPGELETVSEELWSAILDLANYYKGTICDGLRDIPITADIEASGEGARLSYMFDGSLPHAEALYAATRLLFSAHLDHLHGVIGNENWMIEEPRDDLPQTLDSVATMLGEGEPLLNLMRPDAGFVDSLVTMLSENQPEIIKTVAWYLAATARPPVEAVERLVDACLAARDPGVTAMTRKTLRLLAPRIQLGALMDAHLSSRDPVAAALALELLDEAVASGRLNAAWRIGPLLEALRLGDVAAETAAEKLASAVDKNNPEQFRRVCEALVAFLAGEPPFDARHNAVLSLVNLVLNRPTAPDRVIAALQAQRDTPEPVSTLVQWALHITSSRPVEHWESSPQ